MFYAMFLASSKSAKFEKLTKAVGTFTCRLVFPLHFSFSQTSTSATNSLIILPYTVPAVVAQIEMYKSIRRLNFSTAHSKKNLNKTNDCRRLNF